MAYTPKHRFFRVLVPKAGTHPLIDPRSAIVTREPVQADGGQVLVYFEGNRLGAENLRQFVERARCAAGRDSEKYPTVAMAKLPLEDFLDVGRLDLLTGELLTLSQPATLVEWLDGEPLPPVGAERFLIFCRDEHDAGDGAGFWSNEFGWTTRCEATVFTRDELSRIRLPMGCGPVTWQHALPTDGKNPLEQPLRDVIADLEAIRQYASPLLFRDGLVVDVAHKVGAAEADQVEAILKRLTEACEASDDHDLGEIYSGRLPDELQHHLASDHADERLDDAKRVLQEATQGTAP